MKQSSSIDEVETWLEGIMAYNSVANITKSYSYHTNEIIRDSPSNHQKRIQPFNQSAWWSVCKCALEQTCILVSHKSEVID